MGQHDVSGQDELASQRFRRTLLNDLEALEYMLKHGLIHDATPQISLATSA